MGAKKPSQASVTIFVRQLGALVSELAGGPSGYPDPDNPNPPGPWDPYIRKALLRLGLIFGPTPDPWKTVFGPGPQPWHWSALNPQPLPPKAAFAAFIAQEVMERAALVQDVADAMAEAGQSQGIIIVGGLVSRFIDDCGNGLIWRKRPFPPPKGDEDNRLTGLELIVMGTQFEQQALTTANDQLQQTFRDAGARLIEMGVSRL